MKGFLEITFGPMFSGKTTDLIQKVHQYLDINEAKGILKTALIINSSLDKRDINKYNILTSHSSVKKELKDSIECITTNLLREVDPNDFDYIAIDESQFFKDLVPVVKDWLQLGKKIHCVGLIADVNKKRFGDLLDLIPEASKINQLKAYCILCKDHLQNAPFTKLKKSTGEKSVVFVGEKDYYIPVCHEHY